MVDLPTVILVIDTTLDLTGLEIKDIRTDYSNNERYKIRTKKREVFYVERIPESFIETRPAPLKHESETGSHRNSPTA